MNIMSISGIDAAAAAANVQQLSRMGNAQAQAPVDKNPPPAPKPAVAAPTAASGGTIDLLL